MVLSTVQLVLLPLGRSRDSFSGWDSVPATPPACSDAACWNCCHTFSWPATSFPLAWNKERGIFLGRGTFCSLNCAKTWGIDQGNLKGLPLVALLAHKARVAKTEKRGELVHLLNLPSKNRLRMFGGEMTIDEFRNGSLRIDGEIIGTPPSFVDTLMHRSTLLPPIFITESDLLQTKRMFVVNGNPVPYTNDGDYTFDFSNKRTERAKAISKKRSRSSNVPPECLVAASLKATDCDIKTKLAKKWQSEGTRPKSNSARTLSSVMGVKVTRTHCI